MNTILHSFKQHPAIALFGAVLLCIAVYWPGLSGSFIFDDYQNVQQNELIRIDSLSLKNLQQAAHATNAGPLGRPVSMISFALNYWATGLDTFWLKLTNVFIHVAIGITLFFLGRIWLNVLRHSRSLNITASHATWIALLAATLWMLHPLNLTGVLYIVQRMTSLATLFSVLGLLTYSIGRQRQLAGQAGWRWIAATVLVFLPLAALSKESGLLIPAFCAVLEVCVFRFASTRPMMTTALKWVYISGISGVLLVLAFKFNWYADNYGGRPFTLSERLLSEARILWFYLRLLIIPDIGSMTLYHDGFSVSHGLLSPFSTLPAVLGIVALLIASIGCLKQYPLLALGILFFFAGHVLESTVVPLELVFEHRNYLAIYGLLLAASSAVISYDYTHKPQLQRVASVAILVALGAGLTAQRAHIWGNPFELLKHTLQHHPDSTRTNMWAGDTYQQIAARAKPDQKPIYLHRARTFYQNASRLSPELCSAPLDIVKLDMQLIVQPDPVALAQLINCLETEPVQAGTVHALSDFAVDLGNGKIQLDNTTAIAIFTAALSNPKQGGRARALISGGFGYYLKNSQQNLVGALNAYQKAVQADPGDAGLWVAYAQTLIEAQQLEVASQALTQATDVDRGNMTAPIKALQTYLDRQSTHDEPRIF